MGPSDAINIIVLFILVLLSGFFSSAETAIISVNKIRIRSMVEEDVKNAALVAKIIEDSRKFISTVLIGNNVVNISGSFLGISLYEYFTDVTTGREPIVTNYRFKLL